MLDRDVVRYFPAKLVPALTGMASIVILTRSFHPQEYGRYSAVMATLLLMNQMFGAWLSNAILYVYPDYHNTQKHRFQRIAARLQGFSAAIAVFVSYLSILAATRSHLLAFVGAVIVGLQLFQSLMMAFLQSTRRVRSQTISVSCQSLVHLAALGALLCWHKGKEAAAVLAVLVGIMSCFPILLRATGLLLRPEAKDPEIGIGPVFKALLKYGMPICVWFFATQFYTVGDRLILSFVGATGELGKYASFRDLATGCAGFISMPLLMASHPIIMMMWKTKAARSEVEGLITRNLIILATLFVPVVVVVDLFGAQWIPWLLGDKYLSDRGIMLLVIISIFLACVGVYVQKGLEVTGRTLEMAFWAGCAAAASLGANAIIIPRYGVMGACIILISVQCGYLFAVWYKTRNVLRVRIPPKVVLRLILWGLAAELGARGIAFLPLHGAQASIHIIQIAFLVVASVLLFYSSEELSSMLKASINAVRSH